MTRGWLRDVAARALLGAGITHPGRRGRGRLTIATFHRVLPPELRRHYPLPGLAVTPEELTCFLTFFGRHFEVGPLCETARRWQAGDDAPLLALTFDDAQRDNFEYARPVLAHFGWRATFFAPAGALARGEMLWHDRLAWAARATLARGGEGARVLLETLAAPDLAGAGPDAAAGALVRRAKALAPEARERAIEAAEGLAGDAGPPAWEGLMDFGALRALRREGHEIGSHSLTHALLPQLGDEALRREVAGSRSLLETELGEAVESFCFPNGDFDDRTLREVAAAGYRWGVTTRWGANARGSDPLRLARYEMHAEHAQSRDGRFSEPRLAWRMTSFYPGL